MAVRPIDGNVLIEWFRPYLHTGEAIPADVVIEDIRSMPTITPPNEPSLLEFDVVDTTTGKYPDWERIAREESWAKGLVYCDMDGIAIREDGSLILLDECGNCVSCPPDRFEIRRCPPEGGGEHMTNADKIRAMSDEELAWELMTWRLDAVARNHGVEGVYPDTQKEILKWLHQPAKEDT